MHDHKKRIANTLSLKSRAPSQITLTSCDFGCKWVDDDRCGAHACYFINIITILNMNLIFVIRFNSWNQYEKNVSFWFYLLLNCCSYGWIARISLWLSSFWLVVSFQRPATIDDFYLLCWGFFLCKPNAHGQINQWKAKQKKETWKKWQQKLATTITETAVINAHKILVSPVTFPSRSPSFIAIPLS